jgi:hypothetical protein
MWSEFDVKKSRTRMPYKRSLGRQHTFCIKLESSKFQPNRFFHIFLSPGLPVGAVPGEQGMAWLEIYRRRA